MRKNQENPFLKPLFNHIQLRRNIDISAWFSGSAQRPPEK
jgi:hypothetical protein